MIPHMPRQVVDHQRLSAAGYCYSASAPPFVSAAASAALRMLRAEPVLVSNLRKNAEFLHLAVGAIAGLEVLGTDGSYIGRHAPVKRTFKVDTFLPTLPPLDTPIPRRSVPART